MSSIPYNYGSYIDAKVAMTDTGHVSAGKQIQSPASAGSRGLAKTTQFTNDRTQMQMGNSPIAESMVEIRNILNRIDGVNVPTDEAKSGITDANYKLLMLDISAMKDRISELNIDDDSKTRALTALGDVEDELNFDESAVREDAGEDEKVIDMLRNIKQHLENHPNMSEHPSLVALDQLADDLESGDKPADYESAVREDEEIHPLWGDWGETPQSWSDTHVANNEDIVLAIAKGQIPPEEPTISGYMDEQNDAWPEGVEGGKYDDDQIVSFIEDTIGYECRGLGYDYFSKFTFGEVKDYYKPTPQQIKTAQEIVKDPEFAKARARIRGQAESVAEDSGELSRLKELSGIEENAKVNFSPEQIKQLMMWNKKYSVYSGKNGDELPSGLVKANTDSGITSDGYEENEVKQYEKMFGKEEFDWDDSQHGEFQEKSKITGGMMSDLEKIVGVGNADDEYTLAEIGEKILGMSFGDTYEEQYQPFPEGDEFDIEEDEDFEEVLGPLGFPEDETELFDAEYQGRKVPLNKPMRGDVKKFKVYVKDPKTGNVKKVNFGHGGTSAKRKTMRIRKSNPKARKSFRARHNCANPGPKTKARYWSCRKW